MGTRTILFKKTMPMVPRENIVREFIKSCEMRDFDKLKMLVKNDTTFEPDNQNVFLAELKSVFKRLKARRIKRLEPSEEFINLCFFKQEIVNFQYNGSTHFTLMFDTDEGFVKDITIC